MTELRGAAERVRRARALAYESELLPYCKKLPSFAEFVGGMKAAREPESFLDMRLRASVKGLKTISMAEYRAATRH